MTRIVAPSLILLIIISGCTVQPTTPKTEPRTEQTRPDPITRLLDQAAAAFDADQLTTPADNNAYSLYQQVLALNPDNQEARLGINNIVEQYLSWAINNAKRGHHANARHYAARAQQVDPEHPSIEAVYRLINETEDAVTEEFPLDPRRVRERNIAPARFDRIVENLTPETLVTIYARNDAEGRWLYQQLNNRVSFRVQASFEPSRRPLVKVTR